MQNGTHRLAPFALMAGLIGRPAGSLMMAVCRLLPAGLLGYVNPPGIFFSFFLILRMHLTALS